ncbi:MAG: hypothetical protein AVDCRST_MAG88-3723 [uncultured Thermomicrobiales bacterium]|uniref:Uncharacterized protein n=1 Tax=uncultured Thermomicrobiales bacterium TaxID=1645740 RepID=A0A6J4VVQ6_9BACT|nr:MAG: hypothetical protein AVDCRST_MAG88-3723 [uncultured Thermomicrobiales bacterium]
MPARVDPGSDAARSSSRPTPPRPSPARALHSDPHRRRRSPPGILHQPQPEGALYTPAGRPAGAIMFAARVRSGRQLPRTRRIARGAGGGNR